MAIEPTRWARVEPRARDTGLAPGLEARVHDPLWLLGRQWQFGELTAGTGAGSAIAADITVEVTPLTGLRPGGGPVEPYDPRAVPLEALVEAEDVHAAPTVRTRARAGQHFERLLARHGAGRYAGAYRDRYGLAAPAPDGTHPAAGAFADLLAGRTIDGARLHADLHAALRGARPALPAAPPIEPTDVASVRAAAEAWLSWWDELLLVPAAGRTAWNPQRMEYAFATVAEDGSTLETAEHGGARLDWPALTAAEPAPATGGSRLGPITMVPSTVTYPGMAASRLWEFENARVDFGAIEAGAQDLGRMLLAEFALIYGGDWLIVPLELDLGTRVRITELAVRDTFGRTISVPATSHLASGWRMFATSTAQGPPDDALLLFPALPASLQGAPIEEIALLRDEAANLAWAIERAVEGEDGRAADLARATAQPAPAPPLPARDPDALTYRLRTEVPAHWHPLLPQRDAPGDPSMTFRLGTLAGAPRGQLLAPDGLTIREEEVPRAGARVTRAYQLARWVDGTTFLWLGRQKSAGRGEGSSGLRFDVAD